MAAYDFFRLYSAFHWFRRRLCFLWRYTKLTGCAVYRYAVGWKPPINDHGSRGEVVSNIEDEAPQVSPEGQREAAARERPAGLTRERPRFEDDSDDDGGEFDGEEYRVDPTDELHCGYDSTWDAEESVGPSRRTTRPAAHNVSPPLQGDLISFPLSVLCTMISCYSTWDVTSLSFFKGQFVPITSYDNFSFLWQFMFSRFENAARDMQNYRHGYPVSYTHTHTHTDMCTLVYGFHQDWYKDYDRLESVHSYIQWLFPLQEPGMNRDFQLSKEIHHLTDSYKLMLDFYGIELSDEKTGEVRRACNWRDRFNNLNRRTHNNLRITRILKCLGTLGYRHYQAPLVHFFLKETLVHRELPQVRDSVLHYFVFAVLDKRERRRLLKFAYLSYDRREEFVWCPKKIQIKWSQGMSSRTELLHCEDGRQEEED
uniref:Opioid growth factor receptor 2 n=1 Tax=Gasterosteus aculeatus aculeatus TaxID=481459 RepID=A0AAQ4P1M2_GASAC